MNLIYKFIFLSLLGIIIFPCFYVYASDTAIVNATVSTSLCGNNIKENGEECDNNDFGNSSCSTQGFNSGTISCLPSCDIDTSMCSTIITNTYHSGGGSHTPVAPVVIFQPVISSSPDIFDGQYFISFDQSNQTDKSTNKDTNTYEVCEGNNQNCEKAQNPYLIKNQNLDQPIIVKMNDKNGEHKVVIPAQKTNKWPIRVLVISIIIFVFLVFRKIFFLFLK